MKSDSVIGMASLPYVLSGVISRMFRSVPQDAF